jgi:hypothetical protein
MFDFKLVEMYILQVRTIFGQISDKKGQITVFGG